jgi:hypothetical protein
MRLYNELTNKVVESTDEDYFEEEKQGIATVNRVEVKFTVEYEDDPFRYGYISKEEAAKIPELPERMIKFYITNQFYGGNIHLIEEAAKACNVQLIAVRGYALEDYPGNKEYVYGSANYIFLLERKTEDEAFNTIDFEIRQKMRELYPKYYKKEEL